MDPGETADLQIHCQFCDMPQTGAEWMVDLAPRWVATGGPCAQVSLG